MAVARAVFSGLALSSAALAGSSVYNSPSNGFTTSVVYSTQDYTVTSCGPEVSNCPARATPTTFSVFPVPSTCAVTTTVTTTVTYTPTNPAEVKPTGTMGKPQRLHLPRPALMCLRWTRSRTISSTRMASKWLQQHDPSSFSESDQW